MLETMWYELASRSAGWFAVMMAGALKAAVILALAGVAALLLRRASAAIRHQVWLVGVVLALAVPLLGAVLPNVAVPGPAWLAGPQGSEWRSPGSLPFLEVPSEPEWSVAVAEIEARAAEAAAHAEAVAAEASVRVEELAARLDEVGARAEQMAVRAAAAEIAAEALHASGIVRLQVPGIATTVTPAPTPMVPPVAVMALPDVPPTPAPPPLLPPGQFMYDGWAEGGDGFPWALLGLGVWLFGVWTVTAGIVVGALRVAWIGWQAKAVVSGRCATLAAAIADELGVRDVRVLLGPSTAMPMTWGLLQPTVLLPEGAESWPVDQLDAALRHELAHARRRDTMTQLLADIACAFYWFNPLAWLAAHRLRVEREHACDDEVLSSGSKPSDYATQLLDMTRALRAARATAMAAIPMARPSQLRDRLEAVLDEDRVRGTLSRPVAVRGWALGLVLGLPLAMLGFAPGPSFGDGYDVALEPHFAEMAEAYAEEAHPDVYAGNIPPHGWPGDWHACDSEGRDGSFSMHVDDDEQRIEWYTDGCRNTFEIEGRVRFDDEFRRIVSLSDDGRVRVEAERADGDRSLEIEALSGELSYTYHRDGEEHAFDAEAQAWLDAMVLELLRSGYMAEERVAALLRAGGAEAVLAEVDHLRSDYARRIYFEAALAEPDITPEQAASLIEHAGAGIRSDFDLAELLIATADDRRFSADLADAFLGAAESISSDFERRRVLSEVLSRAELTPEQAIAVVASAAELRSDFEKTELLVALANGDAFPPDMQRVYISAAASIGSDHDRRRALDAILVQGRLERAVTLHAIQVAADLRSDHDKAETLLHIARTQSLDEESRAEFLEAIETLRSDYDHARVSSAFLRSSR